MIANSLSKRFPQVQLEQGRMRAGLQTGLSKAEVTAGEVYRDRFWFQTKGEESFMAGSVYSDRANAPTQDGWRRDFDFAVVDRDGANDLKVRVEDSQLVIGNPGATLRVDLGEVADRKLSDGVRLVTVETDVKGAETRTRVGVGQWANDLTTYEVCNGRLVAL